MGQTGGKLIARQQKPSLSEQNFSWVSGNQGALKFGSIRSGPGPGTIGGLMFENNGRTEGISWKAGGRLLTGATFITTTRRGISREKVY